MTILARFLKCIIMTIITTIIIMTIITKFHKLITYSRYYRRFRFVARLSEDAGTQQRHHQESDNKGSRQCLQQQPQFTL